MSFENNLCWTFANSEIRITDFNLNALDPLYYNDKTL